MTFSVLNGLPNDHNTPPLPGPMFNIAQSQKSSPSPSFCVRYGSVSHDGCSSVTGPELRQLRNDLGEAIGRSLSAADMAKLCGLPPGVGADTIRRWEVSGPSGPADKLLHILAMASDRHPILENFNVFDRFNIPESERPERREEFRQKMRDEVRERLAD
jgi:hypothetical protein